MKLNMKITVVILEVGLIPLLLLFFIGYFNAENQITQNTLTNLTTIAQIQKNRLQETVQNKLNLVGLFTTKPVLRADLRDFNTRPTPQLQTAMDDNLLEAKAGVAAIKSIFVANSTGTIVASTDAGALGADVSAENFFKRGVRHTDVSTLKKDSATGLVLQYLAGPLVLGDTTLGVAVIVTDTTDIVSLASDYTGLGYTGETLLVEDNGKGDALFITPTRTDPDAALTLVVPKERIDVPSVSAVAGKEKVFNNAVDYRNAPVFAATRYVKDVNWGIVVKVDHAEALAPIKQVQGLFLFLIVVTGFFISLIGALISRSITAPILELTAIANKIAQGDLSQSIHVASRNEIGALGRAITIMTTKLRESYATLEEKVHHRTHDLEDANRAAQNVLEDLNIEKVRLVEEKKRSEDLANNLEKFKLAVDNASDAIVITDPEGIVIYANEAIEKIIGYKPEEVVGKKAGVLWKLPMPLEYYQTLWDTIKKQKKVFVGEIQNKTKNGLTYTAKISISPILDEKGEVVFFVDIERDITKEKEIDRAKSEFVSLASHQLFTPPSIIGWYTEMLRSGDLGKINQKQAKYLKEIYDANKRMIATINFLLNISRIEMGTFAISVQKIDIKHLIDETIQEMSGRFTHPVKWEKNYDLGPDYLLNADPNIMHIIFDNLLSNALKYGPSENAKIEVTAKIEGDSLLLSVKDNGIGIAAGDRDRIFDKLFRAGNAVVANPDGTGLGLYMLKKIIVNGLGGRIWFDSEENKGTTFFVSLPSSGMKEKTGVTTLVNTPGSF